MKSQFTEDERALFWSIEEKKAVIQKQLNNLNEQIKEISKAETKIRAEVAKLKPELIPYSEMQAAIYNPISRDKYFSHLSKNDFIKHVRDSLK